MVSSVFEESATLIFGL